MSDVYKLRDQYMTQRDQSADRKLMAGAFQSEKHGRLKPAPDHRKGVPTIKKTFTLNTTSAQQAFRSNFNRFASSFYFCCSRIAKLRVENGIQQIEEYLNVLLSASNEVVKDQLQELVENIDFTIPAVSYPSAREAECEIPSRAIGQFLELILNVDKLLMAEEGCYLEGAISKEELDKNALHWRKFVERTRARFEGMINKINLRADSIDNNMTSTLDTLKDGIIKHKSTLASGRRRQPAKEKAANENNTDEELFS